MITKRHSPGSTLGLERGACGQRIGM